MKTFVRYAVPFVLAACWVQCAAASSLAEINQRGYLNVAVPAESSPFQTVQDSNATGFDPDLLEKFRAFEQIPIHVQRLPTANIAEHLKDGTIDIAAVSVPVNEVSQKTATFAPPTAETTLYYLTRAGDPGIKSFADLSNRRFGMAGPSFQHLTEFEHWLVKAHGVLGEPVSYPAAADGLADLSQHRIDYLVSDVPQLTRIAMAEPARYAVGQPVSQTRYAAWATAPQSPEIASLLKDFMLHARSDGDLAALQQKWFGRKFDKLPEATEAKNWWVARSDRPAEFPIPTLRDPD